MNNEQIDKTLNSLDGIRRAPANPFLYQKIRQKLDNSRAEIRVSPAVAWRMVAACLLLAVLNVISWGRWNKIEKASSTSVFQQVYGEYIYSNSIYGD